ncbi:protein kinase domain-containing protein [Nocardia tenerifensis]|nr:AAA domain-containing protein [Nocardia tenerifensis]
MVAFVAVKFITAGSGDLARTVFEREAQMLRKLVHPNIVGFRDAGVDNSGTYFLVMDWVERNLADDLANGDVWTSWEKLSQELVYPLVEALAYTHLQRIEHRDIKPQNVLIDDDGRPLLADFGIATIREADDPPTQTVRAFHSPPYAPPEVYGPIKYVRDVYSLGVLAAQCLSKATLKDPGDVARALDSAAIPPEIRRILTSCVAPDPGDRPRNASELLDTLKHADRVQVPSRNSMRETVWLHLTNTAVKALVGESSGRRAAESALLEDLSGEVFVDCTWMTALDMPGGRRIDRIRVIGESWEFSLANGEREFADRQAAVVSARQLDAEHLEAQRGRGLRLASEFDWTFRRPTNLDAAERALGALATAIYDFHDQLAESTRNKIGRDSEGTFDRWLRVLAARRDLAGEGAPMIYMACEFQGREAHFTLEESVEDNIVGTAWEVRDRHNSRTFGWGEVVDQVGDQIVLRSLEWADLPTRGMLARRLGPEAAALNRQREAVQAVQAQSCPRPALRELLLDPAGNRMPVDTDPPSWQRELDGAKKDAVRKALGAQDFLVVQGPPGTGKTSFIAELVDQYLRRHPHARVLIASQTNVAVDNALEKLDQSGQADLIRLAATDGRRVGQSVRHLLLDAQMKRWAKEVRKRADKHLSAQADSVGMSTDHLRAALALQQFAAVTTDLMRLRALQIDTQRESAPSELATVLDDYTDPSELHNRIEQLESYRDELFADAGRHLNGALTLDADMSPEVARHAVDALLGDDQRTRNLLLSRCDAGLRPIWQVCAGPIRTSCE